MLWEDFGNTLFRIRGESGGDKEEREDLEDRDVIDLEVFVSGVVWLLVVIFIL